MSSGENLKPPLSSSGSHPLTVFSPPRPQYFVLLLCIFLLEILAGVLAYIYYQQVILLSPSIKSNQVLSNTLHSRECAADRYGKTRN